MSTQAKLFIVLVVCVLLLVGASRQQTGAVMALPSTQASDLNSVTIPYSGHLSDEAGLAVSDGDYAFTFSLYDVETGGKAVWAETQPNVRVQAGSFAALLGSENPLSKKAVDSSHLWLEVAVRGPGEADFTTLSPRQVLTAPSSTTAGPTCAHDHLGESWTGDSGTLNDGLRVENTKSNGIGITGVAHNGVNVTGVFGWTTSGTGVVGDSASGTGVWGRSSTGTGVYGSGDYGLYGMGDTYGVNAYSSDGTAVHGLSGHYAVHALGTGGTSAHPALRADNLNMTNGMAAYFTNNSGHPTLELDQAGSGRVLDMQNGGDSGGAGGDDFIAGFSKDSSFDMQFRITSSGQGRSDVGWTTPAEDFAEFLPAVEGLEPGDVLVIGLDGKLARSSQAYQASVAGVYSTEPGFVGGHPVEGPITGTIPLAIVGIVPVKVSAENGAVQPGDLLVASSIPGYAMKSSANPPQGAVIGKALEKWDDGTGVIKMLATLQ